MNNRYCALDQYESDSDLSFTTFDSQSRLYRPGSEVTSSGNEYTTGTSFNRIQRGPGCTGEYDDSSSWWGLSTEEDGLSELYYYQGSPFVTDVSSSEFLSVTDVITDDESSWGQSSESCSKFHDSARNSLSRRTEYKAYQSRSYDSVDVRAGLSRKSQRYETSSSLSGIKPSLGQLCFEKHTKRQTLNGQKITTLTRPVNDERAFITTATIETVREAELEDILQHAKDITHPDPSSNVTFCSQPAKLVEGSFHHLLSVKEAFSKTGAFKYRSIEISRKCDEQLGFSIRKGDGWEKQDGIHVSRIALGSVFDKYNLLCVGDELIKVNKVDVRNMCIDDVIRIMYIPTRLRLTVKVVTPFSKKRISLSAISRPAQDAKFQSHETKHTVDYKIANLRIGGGKRNAGAPSQSAAIKQQEPAKQSPRKVSPYRTVSGGAVISRSLSPIREMHSQSNKHRNGSAAFSKRRYSTVTWSDQTSPAKANSFDNGHSKS